MKKKIIALLLTGALIGSTLAFAGCDTILPSGGGNTGDSSQGSQDNNQGGDSANTAWSKDDDYHWHTEADKALHTVENGACTVCKKEVTHTVGLEYKLVTPAANTVARTVASSLVDLEYNGSYYVVSGVGSSTADEVDLVIPATYNGIPVKEIGEKAFYYHGSGWNKPYVKSVVLPEGLEKVGEDAFCLTDLTSLTIPSTVTTIGASAFYCTDIVSVVLPKTVANLSHYSFGAPTIVYSEWSQSERKAADDASDWYYDTAIYYYLDDFTQASAGVHYWHYENSKIVEYTNWLGVSGSEFLMFYSLTYPEKDMWWDVRVDEVICTVTAADGNDVEVELTMNEYWWEDINSDRQTTSTKVVFDANGEFTFKTHVVVFDVPSGYNGNKYPGSDWTCTVYDADLTIFDCEVIYVGGKICVDCKAKFMEPIYVQDTGEFIEINGPLFYISVVLG